MNLNVYDIFYATDGKIKKVGQVNVNSLNKRGSRPHSNFDTSIPNSSKNVKGQYSFAGKNAKTAVPLSEKYREKAMQKFAKNPDADVRYSLPDVDRYTEKQYNDFGWVRANDVLTAAEYSDLISNYTGHKHAKDSYPITRFGETVIHSAQYTDVLMYVKGSIKNPQITKVVVIDKDNPIDLAAIREEILLNEREQQLLPFSFIEKYYGPEVLIVHKARDYASYREYRAKLERSDSQKSNTVSGTERDRTGSTKPNKRTDRADSVNGPAYSLPEKGEKQFSIPDIARGKTAPELWEMSQKGEITSDDALKVLADEYGTMPKGENPKVDVTLPEQISKSKNVNQFMRNVLESGHLDADIPTIDFFEIGTYNKIN